jgi:cyclopropane-fatty-acyl-phospholipid synthase
MLKKAALHILFHTWKQGSFSVLFWDGDRKNYGKEPPAFTVIFHKEPQLTITDDLILTLGESYMDGTVDIEGPMDEVLRVLSRNTPGREPASKNTARQITKKSNPGIQSEQQNIHHHYDIGNDFFSLWLDDTMSYSCGYFKTSQDTLQQAQLQKMDHILKKLNLKPDETLLDTGSGWGALILHAAQHYQVRATGITLSTDQYRYTQQRIQELGLENRVDVRLLNYQSIDAAQMRFDKIVSVGMFEHVGQDNLPLYLDKVQELLSPGGMFLLHTITGL